MQEKKVCTLRCLPMEKILQNLLEELYEAGLSNVAFHVDLHKT
jgi:hypothetical protein